MPHPEPTSDSVTTWSAVATAWETHRDRLFNQVRPVSEWLVDEIRPQTGQTILEVAAGPGETGFLVAERLGPTGRLISSDFSPEMVAAAQRGATERGIENIEFRVLDAQQLELADDSVDAVLSRFGVMLMPEQEKAVAEFRRVLRPGARCAYATWGGPDRNPWLFQIAVALLQHGHAPEGDPFAPGGVFSLADPARNRELVESVGFTDVKVDEIQGSMRFEDADTYWSFNTSVAGPIAAIVDSLNEDETAAVRSTLAGSLAAFEKNGELEFPWLVIGTSAA